MGSSLNGNGVVESGGNPATPHHKGVTGSLFRDEQRIPKSVKKVRTPFRTWLRSLVAGDPKPIGVRIFGGDPEHAAEMLMRILDGKTKRRFDVAWLDHFAEILGTDGEDAIVSFVCERYGFEMPQRKPDEVALLKECAQLRKDVEPLLPVLKKLVALFGEEPAR